jgi:hypothetical protein
MTARLTKASIDAAIGGSVEPPIPPIGGTGGGPKVTVSLGRVPDSLDPKTARSMDAVRIRTPRFGSPFTQAWTIEVMFTVTVPFGAANSIAAPFVPGEPGTANAFHVTPDSSQRSVTWNSRCVPPPSVTVSSRIADVIDAPEGTWPTFGPMKSGNMSSVRQMPLFPVQSFASTRRAVFAPKFVVGSELVMKASSVSLYAPPSPFWNDRVDAALTVRENVVLRDIVPSEARIVITWVPLGVPEDVRIARDALHVGLHAGGVTVQVVPAGRSEHVNWTSWVEPERRVAVTVVLAVPPAATDPEDGFADTEKSNDGGGMDPERRVTRRVGLFVPSLES